MFYDNQPVEQQIQYKKMLSIIGNLTLLFSESDSPYLPYRAHENIFCKYFQADNLARTDCSADAKKDNIGIGLKTWTGNNDQKVAEFGKLREKYSNLKGLELVKTIANYRNERIRVTMKLIGVDSMLYHIIKRVPNTMQIIEHAFNFIDINNIKLIEKRGNINNTYFNDGNNTYHFSSSKNTLYMIFENYDILDEFNVEIIADPYSHLMNMSSSINMQSTVPTQIDYSDKVCLRLYSSKPDGTKFIGEKSGLNQWNAGGRTRNPNEIYIPFPATDRKLSANFFPPKDIPFNLEMPDGSVISTKICQDGGKAIMSNPNKALGEWLLRGVFELPEYTIITYEMLEIFGIDSIIFTKVSKNQYKVTFADTGTYEDFISHNSTKK